MLHAARASHREQAGNRDLTLGTAASEADLAPLYGATQRSLSDVIGGLNAFVAQEGEEFLEVLHQRQSEICNVFIGAIEIAVRQRKELLLQRNGFCDQLFPGDGTVSYAGSVPKAMP
jgi:hypothetical protein